MKIIYPELSRRKVCSYIFRGTVGQISDITYIRVNLENNTIARWIIIFNKIKTYHMDSEQCLIKDILSSCTTLCLLVFVFDDGIVRCCNAGTFDVTAIYVFVFLPRARFTPGLQVF